MRNGLAGFFYDLLIKLYVLIVRLASLFMPKARLWVEGRRDWRVRLTGAMAGVKSQGRKVAWFHAASLGEFEQGMPVIEALRTEFPRSFILLTFYSPSGYEIRKNYRGADYVCYLPADTAANARDFVGIVKPDLVFFIKYEFWFNYLRELQKERALVLLFAAIFRPEQVFFQWWGAFYRSMLTAFDVILVQNNASEQLLKAVGEVKKVVVAGDPRFDRVAQLPETARLLPEIRAFVGGDQCLVVGSAWAPDMEVIIPVLNGQKRALKAVIVPHEIEISQIRSWQNSLDLPSLLYSDYKAAGFILPEQETFYLVIDNIGMLSALYRYGTMAFIGGAFGKGLHNTLEAAIYGMPLFFGNRQYSRFSEAVELLEIQVAKAIGNSEELNLAISELLQNPQTAESKSVAGSAYVAAHRGATQKIMETTLLLLHQSPNSSSAR